MVQSAGVDYSYAVWLFAILLVTGCILNLLKNHYVFQLLGIAFFFTFFLFRSIDIFSDIPNITPRDFFFKTLPHLMGAAACLCSMVLGFWLFPDIRRKLK